MRFFVSKLVAMVGLSMLGNAINIESHTNTKSEDIITDISEGVNKASGRFNNMDSASKMASNGHATSLT